MLPCNTLHSLSKDIRNTTNLRFLDLIEEVSKEIKTTYKKVGILSTTKTKTDKLYDNQLKSYTEVVYPNSEEQEEISQIILRIIRKTGTEKDKIFLNNIIRNLINRGAEKVFLACTDLGNLIKDNKDAIDTTDILIKTISKEMGGDKSTHN